MTTKIEVVSDIMESNEIAARRNREAFDAMGAYVINLMSGPGAGKTSLLEITLEELADRYRMAIIEGDITGTFDAERLSRFDVPVVQINTRGACHLDANMIHQAMAKLPDGKFDLIIVENVGNLVCPAEFVVGEDAKVMLLSTPEGDDKPKKYPLMFLESKLCLINKIDLLDAVSFDLEKAKRDIREINPNIDIIEISCRTRQGIDAWIEWLTEKLKK